MMLSIEHPELCKTILQYPGGIHCVRLSGETVSRIILKLPVSFLLPSTLGKTAGKDAMSQKPTYVTLLGLVEAKAYAAQLYENAMLSLATFGEEARRLRELASFITQRQF